MFQDVDMYFFDPVELLKLNSASFELDNGKKLEITNSSQKACELKEKKKKRRRSPNSQKKLWL